MTYLDGITGQLGQEHVLLELAIGEVLSNQVGKDLRGHFAAIQRQRMAQSAIQMTHLFGLRREGYFDYELLQGYAQQIGSKLESRFQVTKEAKEDQTASLETGDEFDTVWALDVP